MFSYIEAYLWEEVVTWELRRLQVREKYMWKSTIFGDFRWFISSCTIQYISNECLKRNCDKEQKNNTIKNIIHYSHTIKNK